MAIVQISRIQVRRGKKNGATSIPQLASGEFGWAVDTQELFIGNGSVQEGAPFVGNTRILTEKSNIFDLISQYQYKKNDPTIQTGFSPASPVSRTLQDRLDDVVSIRSFLTPEDIASGDYADAIQRALDQLYLNDATKGTEESRVILHFEAGQYNISKTIFIPPYARLMGAGKDKTVILGGDIIVAATIGDDAQSGADHSTYGIADDSLIQPRYIEIEGITFQNNSDAETVFDARAMRNSTFRSVKFKSGWTVGNTPGTDNNALRLVAHSSMVTCHDNLFDDCDFEDVSYGIDSTYDIRSCNFQNCFVARCYQGVTFGWAVDGVTTAFQFGPRSCKIENTRFSVITESAIQFGRRTGAPDAQYCYGNVSQNNIFDGIGGGSQNPVYPVIEFLAAGNLSTNDYFERAFDLVTSEGLFGTTPYSISEFSGFTNADNKFNYRKNVAASSNALLIKLPGNVNAVYKIHYLYTNNTVNVMRRGVMTVSIHLTGNPFTSEAHLTDEFDGVGSLSNVENLVFNSVLDTATDSVSIEYSTIQDSGVLSYWYEVLGR